MTNRWGGGGGMETVTDFIFLVSKITVDDCIQEIKRHLLLGRKAMTNLDILKSREITLLTKIRLVKAMFFSSSHVLQMWKHHKEDWVLKNWLRCWKRLLRVPWTARSSQSILKEINCREPAWGTPPMAKVMRKEARHTQRQDQASGVPLEILEHLPPKPESAYFTALCSHLRLWLHGGAVPHHHLSPE